MALPLLAGIALGSLAVIAFNNRKEIKDKVTSCASEVQEVAQKGIEKTKEFAKESTQNVQEKLGCTKDKDKVEVAE